MKEYYTAIKLKEVDESFQPTTESEIYLRNSDSTSRNFEHNGKEYEFYCEKVVVVDRIPTTIDEARSIEIDNAIIELIKSNNEFIPIFHKISPSTRNENSYEGNFYHDDDKEFTNLSLSAFISQEAFRICSSCEAQIDYIGTEDLPNYEVLNDFTIKCMSIIRSIL